MRTVDELIKELTLDGFVATKTAGEDKSYRKKYYLTEKSENIVSDIDEDVGRYMARARVGIPESDMIKFYEVLSHLSNNISLIADGDI